MPEATVTFRDVRDTAARWVAGRFWPYLLPFVRSYLQDLPRPAASTFSVSQEFHDMAVKFRVKYALPTRPDPNDIATQDFSWTVNGDDTTKQSQQVPLTQTDPVDLGLYDVGNVVAVTLDYADAAGNVSPAHTDSLTVADTVAPDAPGPGTFSVTQEFVPDTPA